ncbi:MAG: transglycosylase SLT domain-containing protein [Rickettsiaceae bacterium]
MKSKYILIIIAIVFNSVFALAALDREIRESKKCSNTFSYFERKHHLPKDILHSISLQETRKAHSIYKIGVVWPWTINVNGQGFYFKNKHEAIKFARTKLNQGVNNMDIGCMQINLKYHPDAFSSLEKAFTPRHNIAYAVKLLLSHYEKHNNWNKAVGHYHSYTKNKAELYQTKISKINQDMANYRQKLNKYAYNNKRNINN